jgi:hypothetical protein
MKKLLIILIVIIPVQSFAQLLYYPITDQNKDKKHKFYFEDNNEVMWTIKLKKDVVDLIKDIPYKERKYFTAVLPRVTPQEYLITEEYMFFPNPKSLLVLDRKGKLVMNLKEERKALFDSTEFGKYIISTPGGKCEGNPNEGYFMEFCGDYLFYITGNKVICMDRNNFEIIQEYNFKDFRNIAKLPDVVYIFEAIEFKIEIKGRKK